MTKTKRYPALKSPIRKINACTEETVSTAENLGVSIHQSDATSPSDLESKTGLPVDRNFSSIGREIFWIMVTTGIVIILLIGAYFLLR